MYLFVCVCVCDTVFEITNVMACWYVYFELFSNADTTALGYESVQESVFHVV